MTRFGLLAFAVLFFALTLSTIVAQQPAQARMLARGNVDEADTHVAGD